MAKKPTKPETEEQADATVAATSAVDTPIAAPAAADADDAPSQPDNGPEPVKVVEKKAEAEPVDEPLLFVTSQKTHDLNKLNAAYHATNSDKKRRTAEAVKRATEALERAIKAAQE